MNNPPRRSPVIYAVRTPKYSANSPRELNLPGRREPATNPPGEPAQDVLVRPTGTDIADQEMPSPGALAMTALRSWGEIGVGGEASVASDRIDLAVTPAAASRFALVVRLGAQHCPVTADLPALPAGGSVSGCVEVRILAVRAEQGLLRLTWTQARETEAKTLGCPRGDGSRPRRMLRTRSGIPATSSDAWWAE